MINCRIHTQAHSRGRTLSAERGTFLEPRLPRCARWDEARKGGGEEGRGSRRFSLPRSVDAAPSTKRLPRGWTLRLRLQLQQREPVQKKTQPSCLKRDERREARGTRHATIATVTIVRRSGRTVAPASPCCPVGTPTLLISYRGIPRMPASDGGEPAFHLLRDTFPHYRERERNRDM